MHPLNKLVFGNTAGKSIKVHFHNGTSIVAGYIVKQPSATKWLVTADGTTTFLCELEGTTSLVAGQFYINAAPITNGSAGANVQVERIDAHHVSCSDGHRYIWTLGPSLPTTAGYAKLETN